MADQRIYEDIYGGDCHTCGRRMPLPHREIVINGVTFYTSGTTRDDYYWTSHKIEPDTRPWYRRLWTALFE